MFTESYVLTMTGSPSARRQRVADNLRDRGFVVNTDGPSPVASGGPTDLTGVDAPLELVSLTDDSPLTVISAVANAAHEGRVPVLVVDDYDSESVRELLAAPFALSGREDGTRQFYTVEDRIQLTDDTFACVATRGHLSWREVDTEADSPPLELTAGEETVAILESIDGLACPGPSPAAFRHRYDRGEDRRFRVYEGGSVVGTYAGVTAMREAGVRPVPLPLVPEHHVRNNGDLARAAVLATVEDGAVRYEGCR